MRLRYLVGAVLAVAAVAVALAWGLRGPAVAPSPRPVDQEVVRGNNAFAVALYQQLSRQPGNLLISPYSISTGLAMVYAGARGDTEAEMAAALHFPGQGRLHPAMAALAGNLAARGRRPAYELRTASSLWGQQGLRWERPFLGTIRRHYGGSLEEVDFGQPKQASDTINRWVERRTAGRITNLVPAAQLERQPISLVLVNAVYFLGAWQQSFEESQTRPQSFRRLDGSQVRVPMMEQEDRFSYLQGEGLQVIGLPYRGGRLAMLVVLPDGGTHSPQELTQDLANLEASLSPERLEGWLARLGRTKVEVRLPRFELAYQASLREPLQAMGMRKAFEPGLADLSGTSGRRDLALQLVLHKAFVKVNERGTEAAAATGEGEGLGIHFVPTFHADHPFLFLIYDRLTGNVLFMGRVVDPTKA